MKTHVNTQAYKDSTSTFSIDRLLEILVNQYQYAIIEVCDEAFILENKQIPAFGHHTIKFNCDHRTGVVSYLIGQLQDEPLKCHKNIMVQEFIQSVMRSQK